MALAAVTVSALFLTTGERTVSVATCSELPTGAMTASYRSDITALRHWDKSVITVSCDSTGAAHDMRPALQRAIALWNARLSPAVTLEIASGSTTGDIALSFVPSGTLPGGAVGRTSVVFTDPEQILMGATVRVDRNLSDDMETQVIAHELGHALGIDGHSADPKDLMFPIAHLPAAITARDTNTVQQAYGITARGAVVVANNR